MIADTILARKIELNMMGRGVKQCNFEHPYATTSKEFPMNTITQSRKLTTTKPYESEGTPTKVTNKPGTESGTVGIQPGT